MTKQFLMLPFSIMITLFILHACDGPNIIENKSDEKENVILGKTGNAKNKGQEKQIAEQKIIEYKTVEINGKKVKVPVYEGSANGQIQPDYLQCNYYTEYYYEFDHFESKQGKWLGIWQASSYYMSCDELYNKWGFNNYLCKDQWWQNTANNAGFKNDSLLGFVFRENNGAFHFSTGNYNKYFMDEPKEHEYTNNTLESIAEQIYPSKLVMSSYVEPYSSTGVLYIELLNDKQNTMMMCDQYFDGTIFCGDDQSEYWDNFKTYYGAPRVYSHWVSLLTDGKQNNFSSLFNKANNIGINILWLYAGNEQDNSFLGLGCGENEILTTSKFNSYLYDFCNAAFNHGWLRKFVKKYRYWYKCPEEYGDPCWCMNNNSGWVLDRIEYIGIIEL